ncbi:hypothetical protein POM88_001327 [Heracleum sosnowskyi]|uniref:Uncharacterized protein n=1 Tax=Heracleum sosnowskyi TaxID=360622 RepID=A0AAD8JCA3_9APIA|nr:hypothetical protein POM88_001327 [Heracleum sosnowskyi]
MDDEENFIWINLPKKFLDPEHKWRFDKKRFNGEVELGESPGILTGTDIEELLSGYVNNFEIESLIKEHRALVDAKKQVKRKYVTAHHLQQQQRKKKPVHVEEAEKISTRKSPRLNKLQANTDATVTNRPASARRKLDLQDISHEDEHMGENDHIEDDLPPPPPPPPLTPADKKIVMRLKDYEKHMTDYEKQRAINVKKNNKVLIALKLPTLAAGMKKANSKIIKGKEKVQNDEDYVPEPAEEQSANERTKQLEKTKFFSGPTTRSRANGADTKDATEKEASSLIPEVPANIELPEAPVGQGSMADFLALRKSQKENAKKAAATENAPATRNVGADSALPDYEDDEDNEAQDWRHVPDNLKDTMWNYVKQRYIIPEELRGYAMLSIQESWRGRKSRLKRAHYNCYPTDEARLENRPNNIPLETFKSLLEYWGDETVQERAKKNAESRSKIVDTHTAGPKCFSQLKHKMKKKRPDDGEPSQGRVFIKTRKRRVGRKYKTDPSVINYRIEKIKKNIGTSGEDIQELITDGKLHGPSWLIGRSSNPSKISATAPRGTYVQDLTSKIRESLVEEVEAKVSKKMQEEVDAQTITFAVSIVVST